MQAHTGASFAADIRGILIRNIDNGDDVYLTTTAAEIAAWTGYGFDYTLEGSGVVTFVDITTYIQAIVNRSGWSYGNIINIRVDYKITETVATQPDDFDPDESGLIVNGVEYYGTFV